MIPLVKHDYGMIHEKPSVCICSGWFCQETPNNVDDGSLQEAEEIDIVRNHYHHILRNLKDIRKNVLNIELKTNCQCGPTIICNVHNAWFEYTKQQYYFIRVLTQKETRTLIQYKDVILPV